MITRDILKIASNVCREVDEVREERFRRTDLKEIETNEERQRFVNPCPHLSLLSIHILVMALHIDWLSEEQMMQRATRRAKEGSISINITFSQYVVAIALHYSYNTH